MFLHSYVDGLRDGGDGTKEEKNFKDCSPLSPCSSEIRAGESLVLLDNML